MSERPDRVECMARPTGLILDCGNVPSHAQDQTWMDRAARRLGADAPFAGDRADNVEAAAGVGLQTLRLEGPGALERLRILVREPALGSRKAG
jgi:hypothetical protein